MWVTILDFHSACVFQIEMPDMEEQKDAEKWLSEHEDEYGYSLSDSQYMITENRPIVEKYEQE